jgi:hypothetical protein
MMHRYLRVTRQDRTLVTFRVDYLCVITDDTANRSIVTLNLNGSPFNIFTVHTPDEVIAALVLAFNYTNTVAVIDVSECRLLAVTSGVPNE